MVTEGLNKIALGLAEQSRSILEDEIVAFDEDVAKGQNELDALKKQAEKVHDRTNELWRKRKVRTEMLSRLSDDIRELKRSRESYPHLDDIMYESRMNEIRATVHGINEEQTKRATWSE